MNIELVQSLSLEQLQTMIAEIVDGKLQGQTIYPPLLQTTISARELDEKIADLDRQLWSPPEDGKSSLELLREDRDR